MKTATVTLRTTPNTPKPVTPPGTDPFADFAGFRLTITAPSGTSGAPPIEHKVTWQLGGLVEGGIYKLLIEAVDVNGRTIQALPEATVIVPVVATFDRLDGFDIAWDTTPTPAPLA